MKYTYHIDLTNGGAAFTFGCNGKLPAIAIVRHITGLSLKDSKDLVEVGECVSDKDWRCITKVEEWCSECERHAAVVVIHRYSRTNYCDEHAPIITRY